MAYKDEESGGYYAYLAISTALTEHGVSTQGSRVNLSFHIFQTNFRSINI